MSLRNSARLDAFRPWLRALSAGAAGLLLAALLAQTTLYARVDWWLDDALQRALAPTLAMDRVAVVDVDEASMQRLQPRLGAWPYARDVYAEAHRFLSASGARAVAYDILFADPREGDAEFAAALDARGVLAAAALPYPYPRPPQYHEQLRALALFDEAGSADAAELARAWPDLTLPLERLTQSSGARVGVITTVADDDGVVRRLAPLHRAHGQVLAGFSAAALAAAEPGARPRVERRQLRIGDRAWPMAADGSIAPRFPANAPDLAVVPFYQLLAAAAGAPGTAHIGDIVRDRIVFVGSTSAVLGDFALTPAGRLPGLYVNALIAEALLEGHVRAPPEGWLDALLLMLALAWPARLAARGLEARPRDHALGLATVLVLAAGAGVVAAGASLQAHWLFAATAGIAAFAAALAVWLFELYRERQRLFYEKAAALEANRLKTEFLNHMTHELRTPITAIMGFNKFNLYGDEIGREQRLRHSAIIARNCEHLLALVNNNLDLARMEAGQLEFEPLPHEVRVLFDDVAATLRVMAHDKGLALELDVDAGVPPALSVDAFRVRQILINLLGNAIKFTTKGKVTLSARWRDGELHCEVRDTGPGIAAQALQRIFEPFQRAPGETAAGTGLGLAITRRLVELMGGSIAARSQPGEGSVFEVRLPAAAATLPVAAPAAAPAAPLPKLSGRILLADDNADLRELVQVQLASLGFSCRAVGDGLEAIEAALAEPYTVVLLDMDMPFMDGYETVHVLRERGYAGPVIGFTAHQAGTPLERALIEGCDDVLSKPVSVDRLRETLAPFAGGAAAAAPSGEAIAVNIDWRVRNLAARFLASCGRDLARLRAALEGGDLNAARAIGHTLHGTGGSYGFEEITRLGREIEQGSIRGDAAVVTTLAAQLEDYLERVRPVYRT
jgi:signal transduction histidine kinase/FixJ family two-component response regulator